MINWREIPFFRLLVPLIAGIVLAICFNYNSTLLLSLFVVCPLATWASNQIKGLYQYRWLYGTMLSATVLILGYQLTWHHLETNKPNHFKHFDFPEERFTEGTIADAPVKKNDWIKFELAVKAMGNHCDSLQQVSGNILVYVANDSAASTLKYGDALLFNSRVTAVTAPKNPDAFDYSRYLHFQNIHHQSFVREHDWLLVKRREGFSLYGAAIALQEKFVQTLRKHLPTQDEFTVGSALILGYREEVPEDLLTAYSQTGAMHVLAVSGLHVGVVFIILNFLFGRLKIHSPWWTVAKVLLTLTGIWTFALVTGAAPSVLRAAVMFSFLNVGMAMKRNNNIYNTLASSAFLLLLWNPFWLMSVSFQLSYLAVLGIVFFQPKISRMLNVDNKWLDKIWQLIAVSVAAQLMTLPLTLFYFNQFPTWFWLSSLILVPLSGFELGAGLLLFFLEAVWQTGAVLVGKVLWGMLWIGNWTVYFIQKMPLAVVEGIWMGTAAAVGLFLVVVFTMLALGSKKFQWVLSGLGMMLLIGASTAFTSWKSLSNRQISIYNIYRHSAIDFIDGAEAWSLVSDGIDEKNLKFAVEGHRLAMGVKHVDTMVFSDSTARKTDHWFYENSLVQFHSIKLAIIDQPYKAPPGEKIEVDYLLLRNSPKLDLTDLMEVFEFREVLFDASNKKWQLEKWRQECEALGVEFYDINEEGAWVLNLRQVE